MGYRETLEKFDSVKSWERSLQESAFSRGKPLTDRAWRNRLLSMRQYVSLTGSNPDQLIAEDVETTMTRLTNFFLWLTGKEVEGHELRGKKVEWNSACTMQSQIRGFYTHNGMVFPKRFKVPKRRVSEASKRDAKTPVYEYDEENDKTFMNGVLQHFISNLNFRDQTIALCLLSTGADASDLLALNVGFVKDARGRISTASRLVWEGNRVKDGIRFRTFFSREATAFLKRYVEQERGGARDDEPLFIRTEVVEEAGVKKVKIKRLSGHALRDNFRLVAEKMGYTKEKEAHPFRPKRLRHLFRTACGTARIDPGYTEAFMGHSPSISASYLEKGVSLFLREYIRVEPYVTVFGVDKNGFTELTENVEGLRARITELEGELAQANARFTKLWEEKKELEARIVAEANAEYSGTGGGIAGRQIMSVEDLSEEEFIRFYLKALRRRMLEG